MYRNDAQKDRAMAIGNMHENW